MAWTKNSGTRHTCGGPSFGRLTPGCPRCDELAAGAKPRQWRNNPRELERIQRAEIAAHFASERHLSGGCGPVCTFGDW